MASNSSRQRPALTTQEAAGWIPAPPICPSHRFALLLGASGLQPRLWDGTAVCRVRHVSAAASGCGASVPISATSAACTRMTSRATLRPWFSSRSLSSGSCSSCSGRFGRPLSRVTGPGVRGASAFGGTARTATPRGAARVRAGSSDRARPASRPAVSPRRARFNPCRRTLRSPPGRGGCPRTHARTHGRRASAASSPTAGRTASRRDPSRRPAGS